jgi:hypothetical protein
VEDLRATRAKGRLMVAAFAAVTMLAAPLALLHGGAAPAAATARDADRSAALTSGTTALTRTQLVASDRPTRPLTPGQRARRHNQIRWHHQQAIHEAKLDHAAAVQSGAAQGAFDRSRYGQLRHHDARVHAAEVRHATAVRAAEARHAAAIRAAKEARQDALGKRAPGSGRGHSRVGIATWYGWHPGQCASPFLPHGTLLTVTDLATHKTIQCLVTDTEAHNPGRVVDLSNYCFEELAPLSQGVIMVRISW